MMPLWTITTEPARCGCALRSEGLPWVAQRVWPTPTVPVEAASSRRIPSSVRRACRVPGAPRGRPRSRRSPRRPSRSRGTRGAEARPPARPIARRYSLPTYPTIPHMGTLRGLAPKPSLAAFGAALLSRRFRRRGASGWPACGRPPCARSSSEPSSCGCSSSRRPSSWMWPSSGSSSAASPSLRRFVAFFVTAVLEAFAFFAAPRALGAAAAGPVPSSRRATQPSTLRWPTRFTASAPAGTSEPIVEPAATCARSSSTTWRHEVHVAADLAALTHGGAAASSSSRSSR